MAYQRGCLKKVKRREGDTWVLRYRVTSADGRKVENTLPVGLACDFASEKAAWSEVDRLGLLVRINSDSPAPGRIRFCSLAEFYLKADFGADAVRPKSANTIPNVEHYVRDYLVERFGDSIAEDIKSLEIQKWLKSLHETNGLAWPTVSKIRGLMHRIYKVGILHERVTKNPVLNVETRSKSTYRAIIISPAQTLAILNSLPAVLHYTLVLTCAATALRSSEILALRWSDVLWTEGRIRVSKRWAKGEDGETKTDASDGYVPLHPVLAGYLRAWQQQTPYAKDADFVFPSMRAKGRKPLYASSFVADYLRPAAKNAGVNIADGQRFGLHNLRHSLSNWLVNKAKVEPKTVQGILRHSKIQTTLDLYTQEDSDETRGAQGEFLNALGMHSTLVQ
jgi:integrase